MTPPPIQRNHDQPAPGKLAAIRGAIATLGAGVLGAAPHVLHHVGPFAGAALLAGTTGKLLFLLAGFVLMLPMALKMRRRSGSWKAPVLVLILFSAVFVISTLVVGPLITGDEADVPTAAEHEQHHR